MGVSSAEHWRAPHRGKQASRQRSHLRVFDKRIIAEYQIDRMQSRNVLCPVLGIYFQLGIAVARSDQRPNC